MNTIPATESTARNLPELLHTLRLPTMASELEAAAKRAETNDWTPKAFLSHLAAAEVETRRVRRVERNLRASHLPSGKILEALNLKRYTLKVRRQVGSLLSGDFLDRAENVLLFGLPGRGKSHMAAAIGHEMIQRGYRVFFTPTHQLVQRLLIAKRELELEKLLCRLDKFDCVILDDIGYVQQARDEIEVLFTFLGERYERRSVIVTSNLVFSKWDRIFKDPMTTACAIERLVHYSTILELVCKKSHRLEEAEKRNRGIKLNSASDDTVAGRKETETVSDPDKESTESKQ